MRAFIELRYDFIVLAGCLIFATIFSIATLTTKPALWYDEGINIELARNFAEFGKLDLITRPGVFSGIGPNIGSTGYPVTVGLAGIFKLFGFGIIQARLFMLLWMIVLLTAVFFFVRKQWGNKSAVFAVLFLTTFAPFYGNGRTVMGEIPGFIFLIVGLAQLLKDRYFYAGIALGLAAVAKPSVYFFFLPAVLILLIAEKRDFFTRFLRMGLGAFLPFLGWIAVYRGGGVASLNTWQNLWYHFINPYQQFGVTITDNVVRNIMFFPRSLTLIYISLFVIAIAAAALCAREFYKNNKRLLLIFGFYGIFALAFFLKSFGYLRYLIAVQFLALILLYPSIEHLYPVIERLLARFRPVRLKIFAHAGIGALILIQLIYLFSGAKLFYSDTIQQSVELLSRQFPEHSVGVINIPPLAAVIPAERRYQAVSTYGLPNIGPHPLSDEGNLPDILVLSDSDFLLVKKYESVLNDAYDIAQKINNLTFYVKK